MKKVLLVVDGLNYPKGAFEFVRKLNDLEPVLLTGVFAPQLDYINLWTYAAAAGSGAVYVTLLEGEDNEEVEQNIRLFENECQRSGIAYRVHKDFYNFALPELKRESRYADVMIISGEMFYKQILESSQFDYLRTALHNSECPVLIIPENTAFPTSNILAYDGSEESVYALKQFAYIFPTLAQNKTLLVYAEGESTADLPSKELIVELATQHYKDLTLYQLHLNPKKYFSAWIYEKRGSILVSGSFSRTGFSEAFKKSFVSDIIKDHQIPIFIAHK
ncbi:MAG TPA: hypothetical protein VFT06_10485 [Flavisolibacter sp.]|nr:hypothetical protein [Flavisolibacter sp.]